MFLESIPKIWGKNVLFTQVGNSSKSDGKNELFLNYLKPFLPYFPK
jgi:hypothetical protein